MWDLWWTKWHWGKFILSTSVPLANSHSTVWSTSIIYHPRLVQQANECSMYRVDSDSPHSLMEISPSWEAANYAATQEFPSILWSPKFDYRVHKAPHWLLSWATSMRSIPSHPISPRSTIKLFTHLCLGLASGLFPSGFPTNILHAFLFWPHSCYKPCPSHSPWLHYSNYTWRREQNILELCIHLITSCAKKNT
jgi:hypothetical protein